MEKKLLLLLWLALIFCPGIALAAIYEIGPGEYWYGVQVENEDTLIVNGGGASAINAWDFSSIEVNYTSVPLALDVGGIATVTLRENSTLNHYGGAMGNIYIRNDATAVLEGGRIDHIRSFQRPVTGDYPPSYWDKHIEMIVKEYNHNPSTNMLTGIWENDTVFSIQLVDQEGYHPAISNIDFTIVPEPATLIMFGLGGMFLRKRYALVKV